MDLKLRSITDLPKGAVPIQFFSGFGDTAVLMLTVASPKESEVAVSLRAREIAAAIKAARANAVDALKRATVVVAFPLSLDTHKSAKASVGFSAHASRRAALSATFARLPAKAPWPQRYRELTTNCNGRSWDASGEIRLRII